MVVTNNNSVSIVFQSFGNITLGFIGVAIVPPVLIRIQPMVLFALFKNKAFADSM